MPIPDPMRLANICKDGKGKLQCRYLISGKCLKHHIAAREVIDFREIKGTLTALGKGCEGLPPPPLPAQRAGA